MKERRREEPLDEGERGELKLSIQKTNIMASNLVTSWQIDGGTIVTVTDFIILNSKIIADGDLSHEIKRHLLLVRKAMTDLDSILKSKGLYIVEAMVFLVIMYGWES